MKQTNNSRFGSVAEWNNQGQSYDVDDIENLSQKLLNNLKGGDMVILHDIDDEDNTPEEIAFITSFLNEKTIMLNVCLGDQAGYVIYSKNSESGQWEHTTTELKPYQMKVYRHTIALGGIGNLSLITTDEKPFTKVIEIQTCLAFSNLKRGIFLHGSFSGSTNIGSILGYASGNIIGIPAIAGTDLVYVSITGATSFSDVVKPL